MYKNKEFVFASSVFEEEKEKPKAHKSATVKKSFIMSGEYHETYY